MTYVMVDVEANGPCPGIYSMVQIGAIVVEPKLDRTFLGNLRPISPKFSQQALDVIGLTREQCQAFPDPKSVMVDFSNWLGVIGNGRLFFVSDNNGFDWQFVNWYFHKFIGSNPFGHSSMNLGSLYKGIKKDTLASFKNLRKTAHTHNPVDDARGNAEALLAMKEMGLHISFD